MRSREEIRDAKRHRSSPILVVRSRTPAEPLPLSAEKRLFSTSMDWMVSMLTAPPGGRSRDRIR